MDFGNLKKYSLKLTLVISLSILNVEFQQNTNGHQPNLILSLSSTFANDCPPDVDDCMVITPDPTIEPGSGGGGIIYPGDGGNANGGGSGGTGSSGSGGSGESGSGSTPNGPNERAECLTSVENEHSTCKNNAQINHDIESQICYENDSASMTEVNFCSDKYMRDLSLDVQQCDIRLQNDQQYCRDNFSG